jgi:predicted nucleic-acid-binding protein
MISADTNVILRLYVDDDAVQRRAALDVLSAAGAGGVYVNVVVMVEIAWALKSNFRLSRKSIAQIIYDLLTREELQIAQRATVMQALLWFERGKLGFADCLIAALNEEASALPTYTFDQAAAGSLNLFALVGDDQKERDK